MSSTQSAELLVGSASIGLVKSLIDFVPSSSHVVKASQALHDWLIREKLDEKLFNTCKNLVRGLAYPNEDGQRIQTEIKDADRQVVDKLKRFRLEPLKVIISGSLGRMMAHEVDMCYMVSTVAVISQYHPPWFASELFCSMILDIDSHESGVEIKYHIQRAPIKSVVSKIVESIYLNVTNVGHDLGHLPEELQELHVHILDFDTLAAIIMGIQRREEDIVVQSNQFIADLALWLIYHFEGTMIIVVENKILFEKALGSSKRVLRMLVKNRCDKSSCAKDNTPIEVSVSESAGLRTFVRGHDETEIPPQCFGRQPLYELDNRQNGIYTSHHTRGLSKEQRYHVLDLAKAILNWIVNIGVSFEPQIYGLTFKVSLHKENNAEWTVGNLLQTHPNLLNMHFGVGTTFETIFCQLSEDDEEEERDDECIVDDQEVYESDQEDRFIAHKPQTAGSLMRWFPPVQLFLTELQGRCSCFECRKKKSNLDDCKPGCLRYAAVSRLFTLLAHGIADGFGTNDVSGQTHSDDLVQGMTRLLAELFDENLIRWNTWFEIVACVVTGIGWKTFDDTVDDGGSSWAAVQYGSLILAAPWVNIAHPSNISGCFGVTRSEGVIDGVPDTFAMICCESDQTERSNWADLDGADDGLDSIQTSNYSDADLSLLDTLAAEQITPIFRTQDSTYRLMTAVSAGRYLRVVDPSAVPAVRSRALEPHCNHALDSNLSLPATLSVQIDDFDTVLEQWYKQKPRFNVIEMTKILDDELKLQVSLRSLASRTVIRSIRSCCLNCAVLASLQGLADGKQGKRPYRIVNVDTLASKQKHITQ